MKTVLAFHIIFMVAWFAALFYLPRLFVYHASTKDDISNQRFKVMERRLFWGIMTPAALLTTAFGFWTMSYYWAWYSIQPWMQTKLVLVLLLWLYHILCGKYVIDFKYDRNRHRECFYRWFNEIPTLLLIAIVLLVVLKLPATSIQNPLLPH